jgi:hypothetical protein
MVLLKKDIKLNTIRELKILCSELIKHVITLYPPVLVAGTTDRLLYICSVLILRNLERLEQDISALLAKSRNYKTINQLEAFILKCEDTIKKAQTSLDEINSLVT